MDTLTEGYLVPKRYRQMFTSGEIVQEISFAPLSNRWVIRQLFPWLDHPKRSHEKIKQDFGTVEKVLMDRFFQKLLEHKDVIPANYKFYFRSAKQPWDIEDCYIHDLIAVRDNFNFLTERNFYKWWEIFNLPKIYEAMEKDNIDDFKAEFDEYSHSLYVVDSTRLVMYYSLDQALKSHNKKNPLFISETLGILLQSTIEGECYETNARHFTDSFYHFNCQRRSVLGASTRH